MANEVETVPFDELRVGDEIWGYGRVTYADAVSAVTCDDAHRWGLGAKSETVAKSWFAEGQVQIMVRGNS